jgi:mannosyl-oligosaccharide alpha-1,3-glucosidase
MAYPASGIRQVLVLFLFLFIPFIFAFKNHDFKTCSQSGFCRRGRALSARASIAGPTNWISPYSIDRSTVSIKPDQPAFLSAKVKSSLYPNVQFELDVRVHEDGVIRVRMDEVGGLRKRYDEAASWALIREPQLSGDVRWMLGTDDARAVYGGRGGIAVVVTFEPLKITVLRDGKEQIVLNGRGLLHMEHFRVKEEPPRQPTDEKVQEGAETVIAETVVAQTVLEVNQRAWFEGENQDAWWEETWQSWTDAKPKGEEYVPIATGRPSHPSLCFRPRVTLTGYCIPKPSSRLRHPPTRHTSLPSYNFGRWIKIL